MKTQIGIIYFNQNLNYCRKHHEVSEHLLQIWLMFYRKSKTSMLPVMLTDDKTAIPNFWNYNFIRVKDCDPPFKKDVLHKVGWIKSQAFIYLNKCLIVDLDCLILKNLDEFDELDVNMAMPEEENKKTFPEWKKLGEKLNGGFIFQNSNKILNMYKKLWNEKKDLLHITYLDELIFSYICKEINGKILTKEYNRSWQLGDTNQAIKEYFNHKNKVLHFHGYRKNELKFFLKNIIKLC